MSFFRKMSHAAVDYGPGHAPEFCHNCMYSDHAENPTCQLVVDIAPNGWCVLWTPENGKGMR
jgi:hypothetical protein